MSTPIEVLVADARRDGVQQLVVGAVIDDGGRVLLLRRPGDDFMGGIWELPSGKVEAGETLEQAVVREVEEETGLQVTGVGRHIDSFDYRSGGGNSAASSISPLRVTPSNRSGSPNTRRTPGPPSAATPPSPTLSHRLSRPIGRAEPHAPDRRR
ncbi:NUDIX domain-containing protein [Nocardia sp. NPDC057353]|uniref:NUDIX domain-containing protein n=1 Tax=Nocardia sp. NPDC057353 TaxID=3346104 RepID=UPI003634F3D1